MGEILLLTCTIVLIFVLYIFYKKDQEKMKIQYYPNYIENPNGNDLYNLQFRNKYLNYSNQYIYHNNNQYSNLNYNPYNNNIYDRSKSNMHQQIEMSKTYLQSPSYYIHNYIDPTTKKSNPYNNNFKNNYKNTDNHNSLNGKRITFGNNDNINFEKENNIKIINASEFIDNFKYSYTKNNLNYEDTTNKKNDIINTPKSNASDFISILKMGQSSMNKEYISKNNNTNKNNDIIEGFSNFINETNNLNSLKEEEENSIIKKLNFTDEKNYN